MTHATPSLADQVPKLTDGRKQVVTLGSIRAEPKVIASSVIIVKGRG